MAGLADTELAAAGISCSCSSQNFFRFRSRLPDTTSGVAAGVVAAVDVAAGVTESVISTLVAALSFGVWLTGLFCWLAIAFVVDVDDGVFSSVLDCRSDLRERRFSFFVLAMTRSAVGVAGDSSVDFLAVGVVFVGALGDDGDDAAEEAGRKFKSVLTSNFRLRSRLKFDERLNQTNCKD